MARRTGTQNTAGSVQGGAQGDGVRFCQAGEGVLRKPQEERTNAVELLMGQVELLPAANRRIFANRHLRLDRLDWIGFDMDYTLVRYHTLPMETLIYQKGLAKLLQAGFPSSIASFRYDPTRIVRGAIIDKATGNIVQMDRHRHVKSAYHGHRPLSKKERRCYRSERFSFTDSDRFYLVDTLFSVPEACLYSDMVHWYATHEDEQEQALDFWKLFDAVRHAIDSAHRDESIHEAIAANLEAYVQRDPEIAMTLERFRVSGKRLFLLTNSDWHYTNKVMNYLFEEDTHNDWKDYFDLVIVFAKKPGFFAHDAPFTYLTPEGDTTGEGHEIGDHRFLRGGNLASLQAHLGTGDHVLYVGDHIYGDILRTKKTSPWRTMLIVEELERELHLLHTHHEELTQWEDLEAQRAHLDAELGYQEILLEQLLQLDSDGSSNNSARVTLKERTQLSAIQRAQQLSQQLREQLSQVVKKSSNQLHQLELRFNPHWGMIFRCGNQTSYFGEQLRNYACIYTSRVSNLLYYSPSQHFRPPRPLLPHEHVDPPQF